LEEAQLRDLGRRFEDAKQHMPTRWDAEYKVAVFLKYL
jgi:hypothetical protein